MMLNANGTYQLYGPCPCCGDTGSTKWMQVPDRFGNGYDSYILLRCSSCFHIWLGNKPAPEEMGFFYGEQYHRAVGRAGEASPERWKRVQQVITKYKTSGNILDIGCSSGGFLTYMKRGPWKLHGIEASLPTAERARSLTGAEVFAGDVIDCDFLPGSFDVITCSDVLEHLYEPQKVFQRVYDWLKPGGIFYIFVPNIMSWEARLFRTYWYGLDLPRHLHHFSRRSLSGLAASVNLRQVRMVTPAGCYLEPSSAILLDDFARRAGIKRQPLDLSAKPGMTWRVMRKGLRLTLEAFYSKLASSCGTAASIQAVFQKDNPGPSPTHIRQNPTRLAESMRISTSPHDSADRDVLIRQ